MAAPKACTRQCNALCVACAASGTDARVGRRRDPEAVCQAEDHAHHGLYSMANACTDREQAQVMVNQKIKEIQDRPFRSIYEDSKGQLWRDPVVPARQQHVMHALFLLGKENE
jgi:hypothetical protein